MLSKQKRVRSFKGNKDFIAGRAYIGFAGSLLVLFLSFGQAFAAEKDDWNLNSSRHFNIYYRNAPKEFVKTVEASAEEYYHEVTRNLGFYRMQNWTFDRKATIYIFDDLEDYRRRSGMFVWSVGTANTRMKTIRTFPASHGFFDSVLPHELGHIIFREYVGYRSRIPLWFEEGVAMHQEKAKRWDADQKVKKAISDGTFIPLRRLTSMRLHHDSGRETIELFYNESASVFNFLMKKIGKHRFARLCRDLKDGDNFEQVLTRVYPRFRSLEDLNDLWVKSIER